MLDEHINENVLHDNEGDKRRNEDISHSEEHHHEHHHHHHHHSSEDGEHERHSDSFHSEGHHHHHHSDEEKSNEESSHSEEHRHHHHHHHSDDKLSNEKSSHSEEHHHHHHHGDEENSHEESSCSEGHHHHHHHSDDEKSHKESSRSSEEHHHHHHHHSHSSIKKKVAIIMITIVLLVSAYFLEQSVEMPVWMLLIIYLVPYLLVGFNTIKEAFIGLFHGEAFNEHFLMTIATAGALCIGFFPNSHPEFLEAVFVMLFFQIGEIFEEYAEGRSSRSIKHLLDLAPHRVNLEHNGSVASVRPEKVHVGDIIVVRPGDKIPLDGEIIEGASMLDTKALTGESLPRHVELHDKVLSGCICSTGILRIRVETEYSESTVTKIINLVKNAHESKAKSENFITKFARAYTPIVVILAVLLALVPPLCIGQFSAQLPIWLERALTFLVISCPCALVISVPLTFFGGIGSASRNGILFKGSGFMDVISHVQSVVFDKTGTLTKGQLSVKAVHSDFCDAQELLHYVAHVERYSSHPIAAALLEAYPDEHDECEVKNMEEFPGLGAKAQINGREVCVGNEKMMNQILSNSEIKASCCADAAGTIVHVAVEGVYAGHVCVSDQIKEESKTLVKELKKLGVLHTVMLSGDRKRECELVAKELKVDEYHSDLLPADKLSHVERLIKQYHPLAFVGDGINDSPVLARADVGIAMGGLGSDAAISSADVVIMDDNISKVGLAISIARRTIGIAYQNIWLALGVKVIVLLLAALGLATMWMAVFADVGVMVLAVLNAIRALKK